MQKDHYQKCHVEKNQLFLNSVDENLLIIEELSPNYVMRYSLSQTAKESFSGCMVPLCHWGKQWKNCGDDGLCLLIMSSVWGDGWVGSIPHLLPRLSGFIIAPLLSWKSNNISCGHKLISHVQNVELTIKRSMILGTFKEHFHSFSGILICLETKESCFSRSWRL